MIDLHETPQVWPFAVLYDMPFFTGIMRDHSRFLRDGVDPSSVAITSQADYMAMLFDRLLAETLGLQYDYGPDLVMPVPRMLVQQTLEQVVALRDFKAALYNEMKERRVLAMIPADLVDHVRREADYYINLLGQSMGSPPITRETLGLPGEGPVRTVPRAAARLLPDDARAAISLEVIEFWGRIHGEHAALLASMTIPQEQERLRRRLLRFVRPFARIVRAARAAEAGRRSSRRVIARSLRVFKVWTRFVGRLAAAVVRGTVPEGRMNTWPLLVDHIHREAQYSTDLLWRVSFAPDYRI